MIHFMFDAFSAWFFISLAILLCIEIAISENDAYGWGFFWVGVWMILAVCFTDFNPLPWIIAHWLATIALAIGYVVVGVGYAFFRWMIFVRDPESYSRYSPEKGIFNPANFKERIITWMMWWPPSALWWLLRWPRKIFTALYNSLAGSFQRIADNAAKGNKS